LKAIEKELKGELKQSPYKRIKKKLRLSEILGTAAVKKDKPDITMVLKNDSSGVRTEQDSSISLGTASADKA